MTKRQQIVDALKAQLKNLEQLDPFWKTVTFLEWENSLDTTTLPALIIFDKEDHIEQKSQEHRHELIIEIELYSSGDYAKPNFMREKMAEILQTLKEDTQECDYKELLGTNLEIDNAEKKVATVQIRLQIQYFNDFWGM